MMDISTNDIIQATLAALAEFDGKVIDGCVLAEMQNLVRKRLDEKYGILATPILRDDGNTIFVDDIIIRF